MESALAQSPDLAEPERQLLETWLREFEQNWSPECLLPRVANLPGDESPWRRPALIGMVRIDMRRSWQPGTKKFVEKYVKAFPELRGAAGVPLELLQEELDLRKSSGQSSSIVQFVLRFPAQAQQIRRWAESEEAPETTDSRAPSTTRPTPPPVVSATASTPPAQLSRLSSAAAVPPATKPASVPAAPASVPPSKSATSPAATSAPIPASKPSVAPSAPAVALRPQPAVAPAPPSAPAPMSVAAPSAAAAASKPATAPESTPAVVPPPAPTSRPPSTPTFTPASAPASIPASAQAVTSGSPWSLSGDLTGTFGRYLIERRLGRGGMGTVYLARDTQLDRHVALKIPNFEDGAEMPARFRQEARAAAGLTHPNICAVFDVGQCNGVHYLCMTYIDGQPLSEQLRGKKALPTERAVDLVRRIALALDHAHSVGVIHRDLKPSNIMIDARGEPIVMDFGLARRCDSQSARLTINGQTLGTLAYMPPEQLRGQLDEIGPHSDIYSLGVMLYELLTGRMPFDGSAAEIVGKLLTDDPPPMSKYQPALAGSPLNGIVQRAMKKATADRYGSMAEFAEALSSPAAKSSSSAPATRPKTAPRNQIAAAAEPMASTKKSRSSQWTTTKVRVALVVILIVAALIVGAAWWLTH